jgi:uncharacterized protein YyaL (SSP411 family)
VLAEKLTAEETALEFGFRTDHIDKLTIESKARLMHERDKRPRPDLDNKIITSWNGSHSPKACSSLPCRLPPRSDFHACAGLMISAFARASEVLGDKRYAESARKCAHFIQDQLYDEQEAILYRTWREGRGNVRGFSEDYSFMIQALLGAFPNRAHAFAYAFAAQRFTGTQTCTRRRRRSGGCGGPSDCNIDRTTCSTTAQLVHSFRALARRSKRPPNASLWRSGGYFNTVKDDASLLARVRDDQDGAEPSSNCTASCVTQRRRERMHSLLFHSRFSHESAAPVAHDGKR